MDRKPIKIPGKRKRNQNVVKKKTVTSTSGHPRGRPLKLTASDSRVQDSVQTFLPSRTPKKRSMKNIKSRKQMSLLEKLPVELLELIFLFERNFSFPRSSPVIAGKLSREGIYLQITIEAFHPMWEPFNADACAKVDWESVESFQSAILRCRWATVPRLLKAKDRWLERHSRDDSDFPRWIIPDDSFEQDQLNREWPSGLTSLEYFNANFARFTNFHLMDEVHNRTSWKRDCDVSTMVEIPESLLLGPWSEEQIKLLFWLVKSGVRVDWRDSTSGEASSEGLRRAISAGDLRVIHLLLKAQPDKILDNPYTLKYALRNAGGNKFQVVNFILMVVVDSSLRTWADIIESEVDDLTAKATREGNREELDFIDAILQTRWYEELQDRKPRPRRAYKKGLLRRGDKS